KENWRESEGAIVDTIKIGSQKDEVEDLAGIQIRGHIRLGDRMKLNDQPEAALIQYRKALEMEPNNPVALSKCARLLIESGEKEEAIELLKRSTRENPNYALAYLLLAEQLLWKKNLKESEMALLEANAIHPFNPKTHDLLTILYKESGDKKNEQKEQGILESLLNP
ncbi:MAG: tetratricopeptide repeat protein, partial [Elusimicrobia bacterium]|nr:tetratricopeptide repeat protein [Elusimicrobiota bacterium]